MHYMVLCLASFRQNSKKHWNGHGCCKGIKFNLCVVVVVQNTFIHRVQTKLRLLLAYKFFLGVGTGIEY